MWFGEVPTSLAEAKAVLKTMGRKLADGESAQADKADEAGVVVVLALTALGKN